VKQETLEATPRIPRIYPWEKSIIRFLQKGHTLNAQSMPPNPDSARPTLDLHVCAEYGNNKGRTTDEVKRNWNRERRRVMREYKKAIDIYEEVRIFIYEDIRR